MVAVHIEERRPRAHASGRSRPLQRSGPAGDEPRHHRHGRRPAGGDARHHPRRRRVAAHRPGDRRARGDPALRPDGGLRHPELPQARGGALQQAQPGLGPGRPPTALRAGAPRRRALARPRGLDPAPAGAAPRPEGRVAGRPARAPHRQRRRPPGHGQHVRHRRHRPGRPGGQREGAVPGGAAGGPGRGLDPTRHPRRAVPAAAPRGRDRGGRAVPRRPGQRLRDHPGPAVPAGDSGGAGGPLQARPGLPGPAHAGGQGSGGGSRALPSPSRPA